MNTIVKLAADPKQIGLLRGLLNKAMGLRQQSIAMGNAMKEGSTITAKMIERMNPAERVNLLRQHMIALPPGTSMGGLVSQPPDVIAKAILNNAPATLVQKVLGTGLQNPLTSLSILAGVPTAGLVGYNMLSE